jgi:hypothetical protein
VQPFEITQKVITIFTYNIEDISHFRTFAATKTEKVLAAG